MTLQINEKPEGTSSSTDKGWRTRFALFLLFSCITIFFFLQTYIFHQLPEGEFNNLLTSAGVIIALASIFIPKTITNNFLHIFLKTLNIRVNNRKVSILINYIDLDKYWMEWVKWKLEQWEYKVSTLRWDENGDFKETLREAEKQKRMLFIISNETLELLEESDPKWFHKWKKNNRRKSLNALICVREEAYKKLRGYDKKLRLLNFTNTTVYFVTEQWAKEQLKLWCSLKDKTFIQVDKLQHPNGPRYPGTYLNGQLPLPRHDPNFTGREKLLQQLQQALVPAKARILLSGLRGSGKSALAKEYVHRNHDRYRYILWLDVGRRQYQKQLADIITVLTISKAPTQNDEDAFINWLCMQEYDGWLLILNGYVNSTKIGKFWERDLQGMLLVTVSMKITEVDFCPQCEIEVPSMGNEEARDFLKSRTLTVDRQLSSKDEEAIGKIVKTLGGLPEALLAASLYIKNNGYDFTQFIEEYQKRRNTYEQKKIALGQQTYASQAQGKELDVIYSWWYYFEKVEKESPEAANLLRYCTMLDPITIHIEIIDNIPSSKLPDSRDAIRKLGNYFLIQRNQEKLSIDPHIKNFIQYRLDKDTKKDLFSDIMQAFSKTLEATSIQNMRRAQVYEIQFDTCREFVNNYNIESGVADLYDSYGRYLVESADYKKAGELLEESWKMRQRSNTQDKLELKQATNRSYKAELLYAKGKFAEAKALLEVKVLPLRERILGKYCMEVAITYYHLARLAYVLGMKYMFDVYCDVLCDIHGLFQKQNFSIKNSIFLFKQQGAIDHMREDYRESIKKYGEAITVAKNAQADPKIKLFEKEAFAIEIKICEARQGRGYIALRETQQYEKVEEQYRRLLRIYTETFKTNPHPEIAQIYLGLAELYKIQHEDDLAKDYYNTARDIYTQGYKKIILKLLRYVLILPCFTRESASTPQRRILITMP